MHTRILRGVRVATPEGIRAASVHVRDGVIVAIAGYDDVPRLAEVEELGKSVLMAGLIVLCKDTTDGATAAQAGITTLVCADAGSAECWVDRVPYRRGEYESSPLLDLYLARTWTDARQDNQSIESLGRRLSLEPATRLELAQRKGQLSVGCDADFVIWNPELTVVGTAPPLYGAIRQTILRGRTLVMNGELVGVPEGRVIARRIA